MNSEYKILHGDFVSQKIIEIGLELILVIGIMVLTLKLWRSYKKN